MPTEIQPGLLVLQGNRAELLAEALFEWVRRNPLQPLEEEIFLVQSNGMAEWLKMALATQSGICAATRVELPGRFLWRAYRQVLGRDAVPPRSPLDKLPLTWRLMQCLPGLLARPGFEPLAGFLRDDGDMDRRLQLAQRLADLYDQYQVYRSDWLAAWAAGHDVLPKTAVASAAGAEPLPPDQRWQATLWRELLQPLTEPERAATRPQLQQRFLTALGDGTAPVTPIARRVLLFGMTHVPMQTLEALAALSEHCQVVLAIPNPCRYHWADIIQGRELLQMERRRQPFRQGLDLASVSLEAMHAHAHPLLAAWGRQGRDFVRQLDAFDDAVAAQQRFNEAKIDLFDDGAGNTLLRQVQARIRDLVPLAEHPASAADPADRSIVFHIAHSAQREVEILHDQLLALLAGAQVATASNPEALTPKDVVVMVPDIAAFAPAIRSVFGQYPRGDARFIPFDIADLTERGNNPLLVAFEWLLRLPQQRCRQTELRDLLDVPAVAQRFGVEAQDLPRLAQWMEGAGIRWGLNTEQRTALGLEACGDQNTWLFGLHRMLLGYASGAAGEGEHGAGIGVGGGGGGGFKGIEPYAEVGGLEASIAGSLAALVDALTGWWALASTSASPTEWAERGRALIDAFVVPTDDRERLTVAALRDALRGWLEACDTAGFDAPVPLSVAREAWLAGIDEPSLNRRFRAGGVTFCTLLPMRAIPFEVVCLLGMNDGDYPRSSPRSDFDLMGLPGQQRPGDRSRREDDRQLMLEALLSARRVLYLSWAGRSARDNSAQPPSVLVSQLRDYLASGWQGEVLASRTTEHPLQPFSRRYFESTSHQTLFTHAREWRAAHAVPIDAAASLPTPAFAPDENVPLTLATLTAFLKNPVKQFFRERLDVVFREGDEAAEDDESFGLDGLDEYALLDEAIQAIAQQPNSAAADLRSRVDGQVARLQRAGRLPMAEPGLRSAQALADTLLPMLERWREVQAAYPQPVAKEPLRITHDGIAFDDWLTGLQAAAAPASEPGPRVWLSLTASRLCTSAVRPAARPDKLIAAWVLSLVASACGIPLRGVIVGRDATVTVAPLPADDALALLHTLLECWRDGMTAPLPLACNTALAWVAGVDAALAYDGSARSHGEVEEACLARLFPDFESLADDGRFATLAQLLFGPMLEWTRNCVSVALHAAPGLLLATEGTSDARHAD
jgi:exodeoxyribonuclease V gamma subunit